MTELLPCPFCGGKASQTNSDRPLRSMVYCGCCGAGAFGPKWNKRAGQQQVVSGGYVLVPVVPSTGLLMSMAIRSDHGLGVPGYYDQPVFGGEGIGHEKRLGAAIRQMRQLHEEVVGAGFYGSHKEAEYTAMLAAAKASSNA